MSRYKDKIREARKWALVEAGYSDDLTPEEKSVALEKADELVEEFKNEMRLVEEEEDYTYQKFDRRCDRHCRRNFDDAA